MVRAYKEEGTKHIIIFPDYLYCTSYFITKKKKNLFVQHKHALTSILSDRGSFCCWGIVTGCGTHGPSCGETVAVAVDGSGPKIVGTNCPGAKYGLYGLLAGTPAM